MTRISSRLFLVIFLTYAAGFLFFLFLSFFRFPAHDVMTEYYWNWVFTNAAVMLIDYAIPLQCTGLLLGFSLFVHDMDLRRGAGRKASFPSLVRVPILMLLVLTLLYAFAQELLLPNLTLRRDTYAYNSALSRELKETAESSYKDGDYHQAATRAEQYLALNPWNDTMSHLAQDARSREQAENSPSTAGSARSRALPITSAPDGMTGAALLARANGYFRDQDYFSAYYYATRALQADPQLPEARRLQSRSLDQIQQVDLSRLQKEQAAVFSEKRKGFLDLETGNPIEAYYVFLALSKEVPTDPDVQRYLAAAQGAVRSISFFTDEVSGIAGLPGINQVLFLNRRTEKYSELVYIGKLVSSPEGIYALDVELLRFSPAGKALLHLRAPYGKIVSQHLVLRAIDRKDADQRIEPTVYAGTMPKDTGPVFPLSVPRSDLTVVAAGTGHLASVGIIPLWSSVKMLGTYGYSVQPIYLELLLRLLMPFSFVVLSLLATGLGWRLRSRYLTRPPILALMLIPIIPFIVNYAVQFYSYGFRLALGFMQLYTGFSVSVIVLVASQALLLALALLALAGQSTE